MFEAQTFDNIMKRAMARIPDGMDARQGSIFWNAIAPAASEIEALYIDMDWVLANTFADTAIRDYLVRRVAERGITPYPATRALLRGEFSAAIPIGSRFSLDQLNYVAVEKTGDFLYTMQCETPGMEGNEHFGRLLPIGHIPGLEWARLVELLIPGEEEEETEHLRQRYFDSLSAEAFGGNQKDYKEKVGAIAGVGGCKVYPVWNGGGTVKLVITAEGGMVPTPELVSNVQTQVDPTQNQGMGLGIAPIGHVVTVAGVTGRTVNIRTKITYQGGYAWENIREAVEAAIAAYFKELAGTWENESSLVVRISQIEVRILDLPGVLDVGSTAINGSEQNYVLGSDEIPLLGAVTDGA